LKLKVKENQELNIKPILQGFTMDAICKVAFGMQTNFHKDQDQDLYKLGTGAIKAFTPKSYLDDFFFLIFFHFPELVPGGFWNEDALKLSKITRELMATRDEKNIQMGDFIDRLRELKKEKHPLIPDAMIDAQGMLFIVAGYETTANTLGSMMYFFATEQDAQDRVYEEIIDTIGDDEISHETIKDLEYLDAFIQETMRLCPPAIAHFRNCVKDCEIKGVPFKKGTNVQLAIYPAHMDPEFYPEPQKFKPERFLKENADQLVPYTWRPFGAGNRACIGQRFSLTEMKLCMAKLVKEFRIFETPNTQMKHDKGTWFLLTYTDMHVGLELRK